MIEQLGERLSALEERKRERRALDDESAEAEEAMVRNDLPEPAEQPPEQQPLPN
jgi:hypothetical protein